MATRKDILSADQQANASRTQGSQEVEQAAQAGSADARPGETRSGTEALDGRTGTDQLGTHPIGEVTRAGLAPDCPMQKRLAPVRSSSR